MAHSVLDAIKMGIWDYEPEEQESSEYDATEAMPGTREKLETMSLRIREGMPLWHPSDRRSYNDREEY